MAATEHPPFISKDENGVLWKRHGECNRCGECCMSGNPFTGDTDGICPILRGKHGDTLCSDRQHPYYLGGCNVFPQYPRQVKDYPSCSYTFERVDGS